MPRSQCLNQTQTPLLTAIQAVSQRPHAAFYTPGHKGGQGASDTLKGLLGSAALRADLTELPELDNLFAPEGVIEAAQELAAAAFGAEQTWFLANGSSSGLEAAILATCNPGDKIIVPRNAHRSVVSGLILAGARPVYVQPQYSPELGLAGGLEPGAIARALEGHPDSRAVLVVSPTYHGFCSDLQAIATLVHQHGLPLLVDEAHGPHFGFHPGLPQSALSQGADLVVQSTHKVLSALTQAAMVHCQGPRLNRDRLRAALQMTQSTSPSYLLLASLDAARHQIATVGEGLLGQTLGLALEMGRQIDAIPGFRVLKKAEILATQIGTDLDPTRLTLDVSGLGLSASEADDYLHQSLGVTVELAQGSYLTLIVSLGNNSRDGHNCVRACRILAQTYSRSPQPAKPWPLASREDGGSFTLPSLSPRQAFFSQAATLPTQLALGRLSADTIALYPPGIPTLVVGEVITPEAIAHLAALQAAGITLIGATDPSLTTLRVLAP
ncbi:MAG: aminotransferase class I/II-fold pyridoxal phosphate-dependent enzyme [Cyanobacteria bacterium REEB459]|nr:aminotransferase class I/II-fold pyridoxal phosphate-dependent enzyme [Cyanobacteria bacterium REEB459]